MADSDRFELDLSDLAVGKTRAVEIDGLRMLVCNVAGEIHATQLICTHSGYSLAEGRLTGFEIECPLHGARFDVRDGCAKRRPATRPLKVYPVEVDGDRAWIRIGSD